MIYKKNSLLTYFELLGYLTKIEMFSFLVAQNFHSIHMGHSPSARMVLTLMAANFDPDFFGEVSLPKITHNFFNFFHPFTILKKKFNLLLFLRF